MDVMTSANLPLLGFLQGHKLDIWEGPKGELLLEVFMEPDAYLSLVYLWDSSRVEEERDTGAELKL